MLAHFYAFELSYDAVFSRSVTAQLSVSQSDLDEKQGAIVALEMKVSEAQQRLAQ